jgi:hypothetical protein
MRASKAVLVERAAFLSFFSFLSRRKSSGRRSQLALENALLYHVTIPTLKEAPSTGVGRRKRPAFPAFPSLLTLSRLYTPHSLHPNHPSFLPLPQAYFPSVVDLPHVPISLDKALLVPFTVQERRDERVRQPFLLCCCGAHARELRRFGEALWGG